MPGPRLASVVLMVVLAPIAGATAQAQGGKVSAQIPGAEADARKARQERLVAFAEGAPAAGAGLSGPAVRTRVNPKYTPAAMKAKVQGTVGLFVLVGTEGTVTRAMVDESLDPELDRQALDAIRQWTFVPTLLNGRPTAIAVFVEMEFRLH